MSGIFKPRMEILPLAQQRLWPALKPTAECGFVLVYFNDGDLHTLTTTENNTLP